MRRFPILFLASAAFLPDMAVSGVLSGDLRSDYYLFQDAGKNDRFEFVQSISGELRPPFMSKGWKLAFSGELRDSNLPVEGISDARITSLVFSRKIIRDRVDVRIGRFLARPGGFSAIDGGEVSFPTRPFRVTLAGGIENYSLYRTDKEALPERSRAAGLLEGVIPKGPAWKIDHVTRFTSGDVDDQLTSLRLRCRRFAKFGWDAKVGYDSKQSNIREWMYGVLYRPMKRFQLNARFTERRYRVYQDSFFSRFEVEPTRLASVSATYAVDRDWLLLGVGYDRRLREEGDLDRVSAFLSSHHGELGLRFQTGDDMSQFGGWLNANGQVIRRLSWNIAINFDQWDSAWDAEPTEAWANSAGLNYSLSDVADVEGRLEHFRTGSLDSDIRGLVTFKLRYAL